MDVVEISPRVRRHDGRWTPKCDRRGRQKFFNVQPKQLSAQNYVKRMEATLGSITKMVRMDHDRCAFHGYAIHTMRAGTILLSQNARRY